MATTDQSLLPSSVWGSALARIQLRCQSNVPSTSFACLLANYPTHISQPNAQNEGKGGEEEGRRGGGLLLSPYSPSASSLAAVSQSAFRCSIHSGRGYQNLSTPNQATASRYLHTYTYVSPPTHVRSPPPTNTYRPAYLQNPESQPIQPTNSHSTVPPPPSPHASSPLSLARVTTVCTVQ